MTRARSRRFILGCDQRPLPPRFPPRLPGSLQAVRSQMKELWCEAPVQARGSTPIPARRLSERSGNWESIVEAATPDRCDPREGGGVRTIKKDASLCRCMRHLSFVLGCGFRVGKTGSALCTSSYCHADAGYRSRPLGSRRRLGAFICLRERW